MYYPQSTLEALFQEYDKDGSGSLDYRELALMISGQHCIKSWVQPKPQMSQE
jgi:Ca2+-binding EF-hand superfamily protein